MHFRAEGLWFRALGLEFRIVSKVISTFLGLKSKRNQYSYLIVSLATTY